MNPVQLLYLTTLGLVIGAEIPIGGVDANDGVIEVSGVKSKGNVLCGTSTNDVIDSTIEMPPLMPLSVRNTEYEEEVPTSFEELTVEGVATIVSPVEKINQVPMRPVTSVQDTVVEEPTEESEDEEEEIPTSDEELIEESDAEVLESVQEPVSGPVEEPYTEEPAPQIVNETVAALVESIVDNASVGESIPETTIVEEAAAETTTAIEDATQSDSVAKEAAPEATQEITTAEAASATEAAVEEIAISANTEVTVEESVSTTAAVVEEPSFEPLVAANGPASAVSEEKVSECPYSKGSASEQVTPILRGEPSPNAPSSDSSNSLSPIPDNLLDDWEDECDLPDKPASYQDEKYADAEDFIQVKGDNVVAVGGQLVSLQDFRRLVCSLHRVIPAQELTERIRYDRDLLTALETFSTLVDVNAPEEFRLILDQFQNDMPYVVRLDVIRNIFHRFNFVSNGDVINNLITFLTILDQSCPVIPTTTAEQQACLLNLQSNFGSYPDRRVAEFISHELDRLFPLDGALNAGNLAEARRLLAASPDLTLTFKHFLSILKNTSHSAERFNFVSWCLSIGRLDANLTQGGESLLTTAAAHDKCCNDIVKALLLQRNCKVSFKNHNDKNALSVAKRNSKLKESHQKTLRKLLESEDRSQKALDKILPADKL